MISLFIIVPTIILIILSILFFPTLKLGNIKLGSYWVIALISAALLILFKFVSFENVISSFTANTAVNPLKILILFISMTILSIFLDEVGFFQFIAIKSTKFFKNSQVKLFFGFYVLISFLTVFTSNDIIILTFTPFICYYTKNTKINPIPYLVSEFIAANTWSMVLIIGNPTNIYLAQAFNIDFLTYFLNMILPTLVGALISLGLLYLSFNKMLKNPIQAFEAQAQTPKKFLVIVGLVHLILTTILLAISSYINLEMWYITLAFSLSLLIWATIYNAVKKYNTAYLKRTILRAPWSLIPFVLSMFIIVLSLNEQGITETIGNFLNKLEPTFAYGISGALAANLINNIPMSVLYSNLLINASTNSVYASIAASNIAAFITPIGALAGIMWMSLLKSYDVKFGFIDFMKYGCFIGIPTLLGTLGIIFIL